jgi:hypothetical protein
MSVDDSGIVGKLTAAILIMINSGAALRAILILIHNVHAEEDRASYKKKMKNLVLFVVLANTITGIAATLLSYIS